MTQHKMICTACGSSDKTKTCTPGSFLIELVLWLAFIVPGLVYSIWRLSKRHEVCAVCGSSVLVPVSSPVGRSLAAH